ncbi:hypothetical protein BSZ35_17720 [Salinibacter sp. 10B]|nr:hypothetical protein BSZ35_17720 [Salinibacter sp. 10B]
MEGESILVQTACPTKSRTLSFGPIKQRLPGDRYGFSVVFLGLYSVMSLLATPIYKGQVEAGPGERAPYRMGEGILIVTRFLTVQ